MSRTEQVLIAALLGAVITAFAVLSTAFDTEASPVLTPPAIEVIIDLDTPLTVEGNRVYIANFPRMKQVDSPVGTTTVNTARRTAVRRSFRAL